MTDVSHVYKYTPFRKEFFDNFYLRCTPRSALNDPFEPIPSLQYVAHYIANYGDHLNPEDATQNKVLEKLNADPDLYSEYTRPFERMGIISFSEGKEDDVMWGHYADNHRGMVIEFDTRSSMFAEKTGVDALQEFRRVKYRQHRPRSLGTQNVNLFGMPAQTLDEHSLIFTKSDRWSYEMEHRLICLLQNADDILCSEDHYKTNLQAQVSETVKVHGNSNLLSLKGFKGQWSDPNLLCMIKVPEGAITSVTCGTQMSAEDKNFVKAKAKQHGFGYYEASIDPDAYRLNFSWSDTNAGH